MIRNSTRRNTNKNSVENHNGTERPRLPGAGTCYTVSAAGTKQNGKVRKPPNRICEFNMLQKQQMEPVRERVLRKLELHKENIKVDPNHETLKCRNRNTRRKHC